MPSPALLLLVLYGGISTHGLDDEAFAYYTGIEPLDQKVGVGTSPELKILKTQ